MNKGYEEGHSTLQPEQRSHHCDPQHLPKALQQLSHTEHRLLLSSASLKRQSQDTAQVTFLQPHGAGGNTRNGRQVFHLERWEPILNLKYLREGMC